jgi:hypothetical protein
MTLSDADVQAAIVSFCHPVWQAGFSARRFFICMVGNDQTKTGAPALLAFYLYTATVAPGNDVNQGEPKSGPLYLPCAGLCYPVKAVKQAWEFFTRNPATLVSYTAAHRSAVQCQGHGHMAACLAVFYGIVEKIDQRTFQQPAVARYPRLIDVDMLLQLDTTALA